jgi:membrane protease YdiL (CAAX protease family)
MLKFPINIYLAGVYALLAKFVYVLTFGLYIATTFSEAPVTGIAGKEITLSLYGFVIVGSILEEILFRYLPLRIIEDYNLKKTFVIPIGIISSVVFGYIHGFVISAVLIQGVTGLISFSLGYYVLTKENSIKALLICSAVHCSYNSILFGIVYYLTFLK